MSDLVEKTCCDDSCEACTDACHVEAQAVEAAEVVEVISPDGEVTPVAEAPKEMLISELVAKLNTDFTTVGTNIKSLDSTLGSVMNYIQMLLNTIETQGKLINELKSEIPELAVLTD
jgi:MoaA/NifB/PqqE/SkfB family radical SAM enzyme